MKSPFHSVLFTAIILACMSLWMPPGLCMGMRPTGPPPPLANATTESQPTSPEASRPQATLVPGAATVSPAQARVLAVAASQIGVVERTGHNDGPQVEAYLRSVGLAKGNPYCAAFVYWCGQQALGAANPYPHSGYSPDMVAGGWNPNTHTITLHAADTFGIFIPSKGRIGHTGLIAGTSGPATSTWYAPRGYVRTIEANTGYDAATGTAQDANGDGVHSKLRPLPTLRLVKNWVP